MKVMYRTDMVKDFEGHRWAVVTLENNYDKRAVFDKAITSKECLRIVKCTMDEETFTYTEEKIYECDGVYLKMLENDIKRYAEMLDKTKAKKPQSENGKKSQERELEFWMNAYTIAVEKYEAYKEKVEG